MFERLTRLFVPAVLLTVLSLSQAVGVDADEMPTPVAIITGSSFGLGKVLTERAVDRGWRVALVDIRPEPSEALIQQIEDNGGEAVFFNIDLSQADARKGLVDKVVQRFGRVDYLFNNAGYAYLATLEQMDLNAAHHLFEVNYWAYADLAQQVIPTMRAQNSGTILSVSSILGMRSAPPGYGHYSATKHALHGLFQTVMAEVADSNIKVFLAAPGGMQTNIGKHSVGPRANPEGQLPASWEDPGIVADDIFNAIEGDSAVFNPGAIGRLNKD